MKVFRNLLLTLLLTLLPSFAYAQDPHIHTQYVKEIDKTSVSTDWMYLVNTPQQFMQIGLATAYTGKHFDNLDGKVQLLICSVSKETLYKQGKKTTLSININGESSSLMAQTYLTSKGGTKNGQEIFWEEKRPQVGQPSPLPQSAHIKEEQGIIGLFMEQIIVELKPEQLQKIANAKAIELHLDKTQIELTPNQINTIRDFTNRLFSPSQTEQNLNAQQSPSGQAQEGQTVKAGVLNGKALSLPRPDYPSMARSAHAGGAVNVLVTIDETGKVIAASAISGHPLLREVSEEAARKARFSPTMLEGNAVKVTGIIIYNFVAQ